jgi:autotransporter-associated beta strand protein
MKLTDSSAANVGASVVRCIASSPVLFRHYMVYAATTISSVISGAISLIKNGTGTLTLTVDNTYSGGTTINDGTLEIITATGLGSGTATISGGALTINFGATDFTFANSLAGSGAVNLTAANVAGLLTTPFFKPTSISGFNGTVTIDTGFNNVYYQINPNTGSTFNGSVAKWIVNNPNANSFVYTAATLVGFGELSGNGRVSCANANSTLEVGALGTSSTFSGILLNNPFSGILAFSKVGSGTLTLSGNNTYTGATTIVGGVLEIASTGLLGGGTYTGTIAISTGTGFFFGSNSNQILNGVISGNGTISKNGTGTLTTNAVNTYTGGTTVNSGTLQIGNGTNNNARVLGTTILSGGNLAYHYSANNLAVNASFIFSATTTITKLGSNQINLQSGTLNGGFQTLNLYVTGVLYFNGTAAVGNPLGQINILTGSAGQDGTGGLPLRDAAINIANGAQFITYTSPTINNNITVNGGAGPDGVGAIRNGSTIVSHTPNYIGIITLATGTNSSFGNITSGFTITGQITGAGSFTKVGTGTLRTFGNNNNYTGSTTISAGTLQVLKASFGAITPTASFTTTTLSVSFSGTIPIGTTNFRFFQGTTTNTYASVTLVSVPAGTTGIYTSATSTLTVTRV